MAGPPGHRASGFVVLERVQKFAGGRRLMAPHAGVDFCDGDRAAGERVARVELVLQKTTASRRER